MARWAPVGGVVALALVLAIAGTPHIGDSRPGYAALATAVTLALSVAGVSVGAILLLRCRENMGRLTAALLFLMAGAAPPFTNDLAAQPGWFVAARLGTALLTVSMVAFLLVFPTGRIEPRWLLWPAAAWGVVLIAERLTPALDPAPGTGSNAAGLLTMLGLLAGVCAQVWRWLRVSDNIARNQTKWVMLGLGMTVGGSLISAFFTDGGEAQFLLAAVGSFGIPISLGLAVSRYRLWDVDLVVNRAVVYSSLTVLLGGLYLGIVVSTHSLLAGRADLGASVGAAALVAVAFQPGRIAVQRLVNRLMYGDRDDPYAVLTRLGSALEQGVGSGDVLSHIVDTVAAALRIPGAGIALRDTDGEVVVARHGVVPDDATRVPLTHQGQVVGDLLLASRGPRDPLSPADLRLLDNLGRHIAVAARAAQLTSALQRSRAGLVTARAEERRRLRRELHDGLAPQLVGLAMRLEAARAGVADRPDLDATLETLAERARGTIGEVRRLVNALRPPVLDDLGLVGAVRETALGHTGNGAGPAVNFEASAQIPELPAAVEAAAYRIAQEALTNVLRHADARRCTVTLTFDAESQELLLDVVDDGRGLAPNAPTGVGILSMRERAEELGGDLRITASTTGGTTLHASLPCRSRPEPARAW